MRMVAQSAAQPHRVCEAHEPLIITRNGEQSVVMLSLEDFKALEETAYLLRNPFTGIGTPEPLKHALAGYWSRCITDEHRMVYKVDADALLIAQLRYRH